MPRGRPRRLTSDPTAAIPITPPPSPSQESAEQYSGLFLFREVADRTRRMIKTKDNPTAEIMTYAILDSNGRRFFVDEYAPTEYYEIGEYAELPVYVKTFRKRTGDIGYSYCVQQPFGATHGEHF